MWWKAWQHYCRVPPPQERLAVADLREVGPLCLGVIHLHPGWRQLLLPAPSVVINTPARFQEHLPLLLVGPKANLLSREGRFGHPPPLGPGECHRLVFETPAQPTEGMT